MAKIMSSYSEMFAGVAEELQRIEDRRRQIFRNMRTDLEGLLKVASMKDYVDITGAYRTDNDTLRVRCEGFVFKIAASNNGRNWIDANIFIPSSVLDSADMIAAYQEWRRTK